MNELALELKDFTWAEVISIAIQLKVEFSTLQNFSEQHSDNNVRVLRAINFWLQRDTNASWKKVVKALKSIEKVVLAQKIEDKYINQPTPSYSTSQPQTSTTVNLSQPAGEWISIFHSSNVFISASTQATSLSQKLAVNLSERETATHFTDSTHDVVVPETTGMILSTNIH